MDSQSGKNKSPVVVTCKRGFACLSLICALQILPQTVLADESASQIDPKEPVSQIQFTDSVSHVDPAEAAAQNNAADSAEAPEAISWSMILFVSFPACTIPLISCSLAPETLPNRINLPAQKQPTQRTTTITIRIIVNFVILISTL